MLRINATGEEIAKVLGVDYDTIANHCKKEKGMLFSDYIKKGLSEYKISLRRLQLRSAIGIKDDKNNYTMKPSVTMQIWLGKQYLGQSDKQDITTTELPKGFDTKRIE